jgi:hypothetical protein
MTAITSSALGREEAAILPNRIRKRFNVASELVAGQRPLNNQPYRGAEARKLQQRKGVFYLVAEAGDSSGTQKKGNTRRWKLVDEDS